MENLIEINKLDQEIEQVKQKDQKAIVILRNK